ncbi:peptidase S28 [Artomyces pyxidatus]|uniref:Peptidase S28 n=1 Tax=Artomyces pyxidatus TaxID=48021 RepID=A0ACB8ST39_9AGAM|nr:peptidase S28 [Artomyces pyxidatus]
MLFRTALPLFLLASPANSLANFGGRLNIQGAQSVNFWKLKTLPKVAAVRVGASPSDLASSSSLAASFPEYTFTQPLDHFFNTTNATFEQHYWLNTRHYTPGTGAPVIVIDGGEDDGPDRLPYLDTGIADILASATGGIALVLEHRYYGQSVGVSDFSTDSLRWLNNKQALEDSANFMRSVKFPGIDEDMTAPNTPWIYYGGSYAGARSAHMKVLYPDIVYGSLASSAVTHAALSNWEYMDVIRLAADPVCSANLVRSIEVVDSLLQNPQTHNLVKGLFNLTGLESDQDFVSEILQDPLGSWQNKNWDPAVNDPSFDEFCNALNGNTSTVADTNKTVDLPGDVKVNIALLNYAKYVRDNIVSSCPTDSGATVEECFGTNDASRYQATDLSQEWRLWTFQVCTQWGYFTTAPPSEDTPAIISRLIDLDYLHKICIQAFPPGKYFTVPSLPDIASVNVLGSFDIAADRLAFIDGQIDPWRPDTPHSQYYAKPRPDTIIRPFKLIPGAVHHWDENGLANHSAEPPEIKAIHEQEVAFVQTWLKDFQKP